MTVTLAGALLLQCIGILILRHSLGVTWLRRPVTLLYLASVIYQGVTASLLAFPSIRAADYFRDGIAAGYTDEAAFLGSVGMLALVIAYLLTQPQRVTPSHPDITATVRALDWRLSAAVCAPLAVLSYAGRGYQSGGILNGSQTSLATALAATLFTVLIAVTAFSFILRHGRSWFLPVLIGQSVLVAAAGERAPVLADAVALTVMLAHAGMLPNRRQLHFAAALTAAGILAVTSARAEHGRGLYYSDSGFGARTTALADGVANLGSSGQGQPGLAAQAATRLDGNAFAGGILQAVAMGQPRLNPMSVPESLLIIIPSALWSSKLSHSTALNPAVAEAEGFGMQNANFLPGLAGLYAGLLSPTWLVLFLGALGAVFGWAERWLFRSATPARLVMLAGAVTAGLYYEAGLPDMLLQLRAAAIIVAAVKALEFIRVRRAATRQTWQPEPASPAVR